MRTTIGCQQVREGLREYLDAAAGGGEQELALGHLQSCEPCRVYAAQLKDVAILLSRLPRAPMPDDMKVRLLEAFRSEPRD